MKFIWDVASVANWVISLLFILGIFGFLFFFSFFEKEKEKYIIGMPIYLAIGFVVAGISEWIQVYVPTRSGLMRDVGIDYLGYATGAIACLIIYLVFYFIKKLIQKKKSNPEITNSEDIQS